MKETLRSLNIYDFKVPLKKLSFPMFLVLVFIMFFVNIINAQFVHPGITHKKSDLDRVKHMVEAQIDPWYTSYQEMVSDSKSSYEYTVRGNLSFTELGRDNGVNYGEWNSDIRAAYYNAVRWYVSGDSRHADKAIEIFNSWVNLTSVTSNGTQALSGGVGYIMIEAAEIIKHTYTGWSDVDRNKFEDMLVYPGYSNTSAPSGISRSFGTFYWQSYQGDPKRHGNQGLSGWRTVMAMGIFLDNEIMYDRALRYVKGLPHRADDLRYPAGPNRSKSITATSEYADTYSITQGYTTEDYGYNELMVNYIWENGQCQESSRDQGHTVFGIGLLTSIAEMAWNQGEDLYAFENDRLLLGLEYNMRYNVSYVQSYPDQTSPWSPSVASGEFIKRMDRTGRWYSKAISPDGIGEFPNNRPVFEMPVAHYLGRGLKTEEEVKWITRARDKSIEVSGYEIAGWTNDAIGWGGLTSRRPEYCYGDPISGFDSGNLPIYDMNTIPASTVEAENFDYDPINQGEGRVYHDLSTSNTGGAYRSLDAVDIEVCSEGGYNLTSIESGEWLTYTVAVPETAVYGISIRYAAAQAGGTIKFSLSGDDKTTDIAIPFGGSNSTGSSDWKNYTISNDAVINKGVQSLKISFSGVSESFKLKNFTFIKTGVAKQDQSIDFFTLPYKVANSENFDPEAIASSGLAVSYSSSNISVATIVNGEIDIVGAGISTITASQVGDDSYNTAPSISQELSVVDAVSGSVLIDVLEDTYVKESNANDNYGSDGSMVTKAGSTSRYAYLKFDLNSIPGPVVSAKLRLYQRTNNQEERIVYDVEDDSWTESSLTWNNKPPYVNERSSIITNSTWNEWDLSSYVAQEYTNDKVVSLVVNDSKSVSAYGIDFIAKEHIDYAGYYPQLVVEYSDEILNVIGKNGVNNSIDIYPNPVDNHFFIDNSKGYYLQLFSCFGLEILNVNIINNHQLIDLTSVIKGVYLVKISSKKMNYSKKLIVK